MCAANQTLSQMSDSTAGSSSVPEPDRMEERRIRKENIRIQKERLLKLEELNEMEAAVQREISDEQKRQTGSS